MDHFSVDDFVVNRIEMRNLERPHRLDCHGENVFRLARRGGAA